MSRRPRPIETPNGPERTDLPYEFEICGFLDEIDRIACPIFEFTIWTEHPETKSLPSSIGRSWELANGHVIDRIVYRFYPFGRTWIDYILGLPYRQRVDITVRLIGSNTNEPIPQQ